MKTTGTPYETIVGAARPLCHEVQDFHLCIADGLDIHCVNSFAIHINFLVLCRRLDGYVAAVYCAHYVWEAKQTLSRRKLAG